jgi:hypothetical protein
MPPRHENNNDNNNIYDVVQQLATTQAQLMQLMTQFIKQEPTTTTTTHRHRHRHRHHHPKVDRLARFLRLKPNKFSSATDPIVSNDWLRLVNKDLVTCECTDAEKIRFIAHLLEGPAAMWWETYQVI